jgi:SAM-dependent methyltransferase
MQDANMDPHRGVTNMPETRQANPDQAELWNGPAGAAWVEMQNLLDEMLAPFGSLLIEHGVHDGTSRVLDIGCGAGATTLLAARKLRQAGSCLGADISAPLIEVARKRARREGFDHVEFVEADAQTYAFERNRFDSIISRFGVMFFEDPVAAFANIRQAATNNALLTCIAWRSPAENPFMTAASRAAAPILPDLRAPDPNAPGQFGFADPERVRRILASSGWKNIDLRPVDVDSSVAKRDLLSYIMKMGPVGLALRDASVDEETRARVTAAVHAAFEPFIQGDVARFKAACWLVSARG